MNEIETEMESQKEEIKKLEKTAAEVAEAKPAATVSDEKFT